MAGGDENAMTRANARTPNRAGALAEANVNELAPPNSAAKTAEFKRRCARAPRPRAGRPSRYTPPT